MKCTATTNIDIAIRNELHCTIDPLWLYDTYSAGFVAFGQQNRTETINLNFTLWAHTNKTQHQQSLIASR